MSKEIDKEVKEVLETMDMGKEIILVVDKNVPGEQLFPLTPPAVEQFRKEGYILTEYKLYALELDKKYAFTKEELAERSEGKLLSGLEAGE